MQLHALVDVQALFKDVLSHMQALSKDFKEFPGASIGRFQFAQSSIIRLLSFLDLMDGIARNARLGQSISEVTQALKLLGSWQDKQFSAPLFEIKEPVLTAARTHRPLDADLLFAIISKVRLDSLVRTLAGANNPCRNNDSGSDCWAVKVIHSLQESIERDGSTIRIDGGKFAKRLASHGDDFRRRHKWGHFLHLTIGIGGLYSQSPPSVDGTGDSADRIVPMVSEQIGLGYASPTFWDDRFTFKVGGYVSGILFRTVVDSVESDAITLGAFAAIDVYDLIELYVAPGLMLYPPSGDNDIGTRFGVSFGMQVPLGSYLEKL